METLNNHKKNNWLRFFQQTTVALGLVSMVSCGLLPEEEEKTTSSSSSSSSSSATTLTEGSSGMKSAMPINVAIASNTAKRTSKKARVERQTTQPANPPTNQPTGTTTQPATTGTATPATTGTTTTGSDSKPQETTTTSSDSETPPEDMSGKLADLAGVLTATDYGTCDDAIPGDIIAGVRVADCYGPALKYTNHPDATSGTSATGNGGSSSELPTGDLGLWSETEASTGEACGAAKLNSLVMNTAVKIDLGLGAEAMMICAAQIAGQSLPEVGQTVDLTTILTSNKVGADINLSVSSASIERLSDSSDGFKVYQSKLNGSITPKAGDTTPQNFKLTLKHVPTNEANTTGKGLLTLIIKGLKDNKVGTSSDLATSVVYNKTESNLNYRMVQSSFAEQTSDDYFQEDGQVYSIPKSTSNAGGSNVAPPPGTITPGTPTGPATTTTPTGPTTTTPATRVTTTGWTEGYHVMIGDVDKDGVGKLVFSWQAGSGDGYTRTFNVETKADGTGNAYFGFAKNPDASSNYGPTVIDRMVCNWAGPNNQKTGLSKVQKQELKLNSTSGVWESATSYILYAPTNSCDWNQSQGSTTFGEGTTALTFPVTNKLYDLATYRTEFTQPTAPSAP
ncbi:MAG: hypothetical protein HQM11_13170 [SAR324 cluster bacterium]|nr:hypothetical protein [SAR324 cluster bacterium]